MGVSQSQGKKRFGNQTLTETKHATANCCLPLGKYKQTIPRFAKLLWYLIRPIYERLMKQTFDEINASVATPDESSVEVIRCSGKPDADSSLSPRFTLSRYLRLVQLPVRTALLRRK